MPWIVSVLLAALLQAAASFVGRVLIAMGLGFVEYLGIQALFDQVKNSALALAAPGPLIEWAGFLRIDQHLSIIISAIGVKLLLRGLSGGSIKKLTRR